ncbi:fused MFS/spermidine synthase [Hydrocarboniphaga sp.]|uniref:fused MFS/spermidine synthase n=1 Tax=Hydrocarboniphaga sp. TaxID=2033016 RepID=UPI00260841FA|nr:fused MFS/spermidine synthase [Hydrocarboniphaga sp.]
MMPAQNSLTSMRSQKLALILMFASGFASLGYQIVWTQQAALWLGHEAAAVLAVVAAFFAGLGVGALLLGERISRSANAARWYAGCEIAIGVWSLALSVLLAPVTAALLDLIGPQPSPLRHWALAFCGTFMLLLPATAPMGATLPAMQRLVARLHRQGSSVAALYAGNTFGAVVGVLAAAFVLVPQWGLSRTAGLCAALNLLCAVATLALMRGPADPLMKLDATRAPLPRASASLWLLAATGLLGIGFEVVVVRVLAQVAQDTVYTFALLLAAYLLGSAMGAAAYARWPSGGADRRSDALLRALALTCLSGMLVLSRAPGLQAAVQSVLGAGMAQALLAEAALAAAAFLPATFVMGALFSHLSTLAISRSIPLGRVLGANTLGAALAPLLFGVWLIPAIGTRTSLALLAAGYLLLSTRAAWKAPAQYLSAAAVIGASWLVPSLAIVDVPENGRIVRYAEGVMAAVSVVEDGDGVATLHIDNRQQEGSSATVFADARQALLPLLLHPQPRRALFLGLGTGVTAAAAAQDPGLAVDAVELLPEVIAASALFREQLAGAGANPRLHLLAGDARRYVRTTPQHYDLIVADNFHPARSGSGSLYTVEHFAAVRERLAPGGLFCQWLPLHQLDLDTLRSIVRSFLAVYPDGSAMLATNSLITPAIGLVGRRDAARFKPSEVRDRIAGANLLHAPAEFGLPDEVAVLGSFTAGPQALARFAGDAALNTDDHPVVAYRAPRITYVAASSPADRLLAFSQAVALAPGDVLDSSTDPAFAARIAAYWLARDRYLVAGRKVTPVADPRQMIEQVGGPLLAVLRTSADFRPAYDPLLQMAAMLAAVDVASARTLLMQLKAVAPDRPEAAQLLERMASSAGD